MGNSKSAAGCQAAAPPAGHTPQTPTIEQAAKRLLDALDCLAAGSPGFSGWENAAGDPAGDQVEDARHELRELLRRPRVLPDAEAFERIYRSPAVQTSGQNYGWRGLAEAVWRAAIDLLGPKTDETR
ncbi:hypothetical protein [Cupriavidus basilensis]|uniref:hypothetical protein n=1 Tax=Cupriavidus basilensis TaxID=68895 RepID=UPI0020A6918B|nr:hypothetical protein [Cupriavidus basilensis]MCP3023246.1 hypothetical protein [Cupriavidus basilensis]